MLWVKKKNKFLNYNAEFFSRYQFLGRFIIERETYLIRIIPLSIII